MGYIRPEIAGNSGKGPQLRQGTPDKVKASYLPLRRKGIAKVLVRRHSWGQIKIATIS